MTDDNGAVLEAVLQDVMYVPVLAADYFPLRPLPNMYITRPSGMKSTPTRDAN
jgi:hypothetical protein